MSPIRRLSRLGEPITGFLFLFALLVLLLLHGARHSMLGLVALVVVLDLASDEVTGGLDPRRTEDGGKLVPVSHHVVEPDLSRFPASAQGHGMTPLHAAKTHVKVVLGIPKLLLGKDPTPTAITLIDTLVRAQHEHAQHVLLADPIRNLGDDAPQPVRDPGCKDVQPLGGLFQRGFLVKRLARLVRGQGSFPSLAELVGDLDELDVVPVSFALFARLVRGERSLDPRGRGLDVSFGRGRPDLVRRGGFLVLGVLGVFLLLVIIVVLVLAMMLVLFTLVVLGTVMVMLGLEELVEFGRLEHVDDLDGFLPLVRFTRMRGGKQGRVGRSDGLSKGLENEHDKRQPAGNAFFFWAGAGRGNSPKRPLSPCRSISRQSPP